MPETKSPSDMAKWMIRFAKDTIEPYKPEWLERREIAKTLISLSSAALIFTITFSASIIKTDTPRLWRYAIPVDVALATFASNCRCDFRFSFTRLCFGGISLPSSLSQTFGGFTYANRFWTYLGSCSRSPRSRGDHQCLLCRLWSRSRFKGHLVKGCKKSLLDAGVMISGFGQRLG